MDGTVLLADDDRSIRTVLTHALGRAGLRVHATGSLSQLLRWVEEGRGDVVITDVMLPDGNGIDLIPALRARRAGLPVIVISAQNTIVTAIRATEAEAFDYLPKPFDLDQLLVQVRRALEPRALERRLPLSTPAFAQAQKEGAMLIGHAPVMQALFQAVARVVSTDLPLIIRGAAGTGKTALARALHRYSPRAEAPLVVIGAGMMPAVFPTVFPAVAGGTLLIENPAALDMTTQAQLVAEIDAMGDQAPRLMATLAPGEGPEQGLLAELYYRLAGAELTLPPLAERAEDILPLARHFMAAQPRPRPIAKAAEPLLLAHPFPGHVRELELLIRRLALGGEGEIGVDEMRAAFGPAAAFVPTVAPPASPGPVVVPAADAPPANVPLSDAAPALFLRRPVSASVVRGQQGADEGGRLATSVERHLRRYFDMHGDDLPPPGLYNRILQEIERPLIEVALDATGGNQIRAAELLGINRNTLRKKMADLDIEVTRRRKLS